MPDISRTVLITGARAPAALHLARLFYGAGHRVILADTPARPISAASAACAAYRRLPSPRFAPDAHARAVTDLLREENVDCVIPTCEEVFYLGQIWRDHIMPATLFSPSMELLTSVHDKHAFIRLAKSFSLAVPETMLLQDQSDLERVRRRCRELVFKPVWSRFANHVLLRPHPAELASIRPTATAPWVAQRFIEGEELSAYAVARSGKLKAVALYRSLYRAEKGAGVCFEPKSDQAVRSFVETFVARTGWTGQIAFDLIRTPEGRVLPLECNPRATSGLHFFRDPVAFTEAVLGDGEEVHPDVASVQTVRLALWLYGLPKALRKGELGRFRRTLSHAQELLDWPGDSVPRRAQLSALAEIARIAFREGVSLQAASTRDIEWNGPLQSSM